MKWVPVGLVALMAMMMGLALAADIGPRTDVAAIRSALHHSNPTAVVNQSGVHVVGNYALLGWYDPKARALGSSWIVFKRIAGERWKQTSIGGGAFQASDLVQFGVPISIAEQLCPARAPSKVYWCD
ncbi:MAG TPA: hypothetical protein VEJ20_07230 [Candidatus Eremiobacteraceae bacterium]|nr:hypothetical protein [Candidatus Eremiobacteraceae bacterium]